MGIGIFSRMQQAEIKSVIQQGAQADQKLLSLSGKKWIWQRVLLHKNWGKELQILILQKCAIQGIRQFKFFKNSSWPILKQLSFQNNNLGNQSISILVKMNLPLLEQLWLPKCKIGGKGFKQLVKGNWPKLMAINLLNNPIYIDGFQNMNQHNWKKLNFVWMTSDKNKISLMNIVVNIKPDPIIIIKKNEVDSDSNNLNAQLKLIMDSKNL